MMNPLDSEAFVTLATNDAYGIGCLTLGSSLRRARTNRKLAVMITEGVSQAMRNQLQRVFDLVETVDLLDSNDPLNLQLLGRPDLNVTFTKLHCWRLTQFTKCVFLDADTLVLQNVDELFDREELSAAPDAGWPDCFNSGVFVFRPSLDTYQSLLRCATQPGASFDGGDQGLLNSFFGDWSTRDISKHLPFIYNVVSQAFYSYLPAFKRFRDTVKIIHFIGAVKPWSHSYNTSTRTVTALPGTGHDAEFLQLWWTIFMEDIQGSLDPALTPALSSKQSVNKNMSFSSTSLGGHTFPQPKSDTYLVLYPFIPPPLEHVFYTPSIHFTISPGNSSLSNSSDCNANSEKLQDCTVDRRHSTTESESCESESKVNISKEPEAFYTKDENQNIEPKVIEVKESEGRPYLHLETHYSEDPLSGITPEAPSPVLYGAKDFGRLTHRQLSSPSSVTVPADDKVREPADLPQAVSTNEGAEAETPKSLVDSLNADAMASVTGGLASIHIAGGAGSSGVELTDRERKLAWEKGQIDYLGRDSFANIQRKLDSTINSGAAEPVVQASVAPFPRTNTPAEPSASPAAASASPVQISTSSKVKAAAPATAAASEKITAASGPVQASAQSGPVLPAPKSGPVQPYTKAGPVQVAAKAGPVQVAAKPAPVQVAAKPAPVQVAAKPAPVQVAAKPAPAQVAAKPAPVQVAAKPAPVQVAAKPAPVQVAPKPTPVQVAAKPAPAQVAAKPAPAQVAAKPAPAHVAAKPAPAQVAAKPAPVQVAAKPAPVQVAPKPAPVQVAPKPAPVQAAAKGAPGSLASKLALFQQGPKTTPVQPGAKAATSVKIGSKAPTAAPAKPKPK